MGFLLRRHTKTSNKTAGLNGQRLKKDRGAGVRWLKTTDGEIRLIVHYSYTKCAIQILSEIHPCIPSLSIQYRNGKNGSLMVGGNEKAPFIGSLCAFRFPIVIQ